MLVNADFTRPAIVTPDQYRWVDSPQAGVTRVMLDRVGAEVARATSLVQYAEGSRFPAHRHPGGEDILVLSGVFSDEHGDYPAGWYLRNPPGSSHTPSSLPGATIFVKLYQMSAGEGAATRIDTRDRAHWQRDGARETCPLYSDGIERVMLARLPAGEPLPLDATARTELLVVDGELVAAQGAYPEGSWLRLPPSARLALRAGAAGALVYVKTGNVAPTGPAA